eukprot:2862896-Prymnesium_polylepis.1
MFSSSAVTPGRHLSPRLERRGRSDPRGMSPHSGGVAAAAPPRLGESSTQAAQLSDFDVLGALGTGSTAEVLLVRRTQSGTLHAMKMISKSSLGSARAVEQVIEENRILQTLRHPFIVGLHHAFQDA